MRNPFLFAGALVAATLVTSAAVCAEASNTDNTDLAPLLGTFKGKTGLFNETDCQVTVSTQQVFETRRVLFQFSKAGSLAWEVSLQDSLVAEAIASRQSPLDDTTNSGGNPIGPTDDQHLVASWDDQGLTQVDLDITHKFGPATIGFDHYSCRGLTSAN